MPRIPQVTRTMQTTLVTARCLNIETENTEVREFRLARCYKRNKDVLKRLRSLTDDGTIRVVYVMEFHIETIHCVMDEQFYLDHSQIQIINKGDNLK